MNLHSSICCPFDKSQLNQEENFFTCVDCGTQFPYISVGSHMIPDFRPNKEVSYSCQLKVPSTLPEHNDYLNIFTSINKVDGMSSSDVRKKYKTKLNVEFIHYFKEIFNKNPEAHVLDLGCGNGGNKQCLEEIGFKNILSVDYYSEGAQVLMDVHCLPLKSDSFDLVVTTSTIEHFTQPFRAFQEIARVLKKEGGLLASASFWESWHGYSCFHISPHGYQVLCDNANFKLEAIWSGWGWVASTLSHAITKGRFKPFLYFLQSIFDFLVANFVSERWKHKHRLHTSGNFGIYAVKK